MKSGVQFFARLIVAVVCVCSAGTAEAGKIPRLRLTLPEDVENTVTSQLDAAFAEASRWASEKAALQLQQLDHLVETTMTYPLHPYQRGLAFEIFYGIARTRRYQALQIRMWPSLATQPRLPIVIWVNTLPRVGNTTLLRLVAKVLGLPTEYLSMRTGSGEIHDPAYWVKLRRDIGAGKLVVLDDFSLFYKDVVAPETSFFERLLHEVYGDGIVLTVNEDMNLEPKSEKQSLLTYITPKVSATLSRSSVRFDAAACEKALRGQAVPQTASDAAFGAAAQRPKTSLN